LFACLTQVSFHKHACFVQTNLCLLASFVQPRFELFECALTQRTCPCPHRAIHIVHHSLEHARGQRCRIGKLFNRGPRLGDPVVKRGQQTRSWTDYGFELGHGFAHLSDRCVRGLHHLAQLATLLGCTPNEHAQGTRELFIGGRVHNPWTEEDLLNNPIFRR
jgi:hypothetical protein